MSERSPRYLGMSVEEIVAAERSILLEEPLTLGTLTSLFSLDPEHPRFSQRLREQGATPNQANRVIDALRVVIHNRRWSIIFARIIQMSAAELEQCVAPEQMEEIFGRGMLTPQELYLARELICQAWREKA